MKAIFSTLLIMLFSLPLMADEPVEINGIFYNLVNKMGTAEVTSNPHSYTDSIVIPSSVTYNGKTYKVTSIGYAAFDTCYGLKSISIPFGVERIEDLAFIRCYNLESITFPNSVTHIGCMAFAWCESIETIEVPESVIFLDAGVFNGCKNLISVGLNCNISIIYASSFYDCYKLKSITIPKSVTEIWANAFGNCYELSSIIIPDSVIRIKEHSFWGCKSLKNLIIPNSVVEIDLTAFAYCDKLTTVVLGEKVRDLDKGVFSNCSELTDVYCYAKDIPYASYTTFEDSHVEFSTLHVPAELIESYRSIRPWSDFGNIVALTETDPTPSGIITNRVEETRFSHYTIDGKKIKRQQKGINIITTNKGELKKVLVK